MNENYRGIDDDQLRNIAEKYSASHAILYRETETTFPILGTTNTLKLVSLGASDAPDDSSIRLESATGGRKGS